MSCDVDGAAAAAADEAEGRKWTDGRTQRDRGLMDNEAAAAAPAAGRAIVRWCCNRPAHAREPAPLRWAFLRAARSSLVYVVATAAELRLGEERKDEEESEPLRCMYKLFPGRDSGGGNAVAVGQICSS